MHYVGSAEYEVVVAVNGRHHCKTYFLVEDLRNDLT